LQSSARRPQGGELNSVQTMAAQVVARSLLPFFGDAVRGQFQRRPVRFVKIRRKPYPVTVLREVATSS
jgi:hypothetical protein